MQINGEHVEIPRGYILVTSDSHKVKASDQVYNLKTKQWEVPTYVGSSAYTNGDFIITLNK